MVATDNAQTEARHPSLPRRPTSHCAAPGTVLHRGGAASDPIDIRILRLHPICVKKQ